MQFLRNITITQAALVFILLVVVLVALVFVSSTGDEEAAFPTNTPVVNWDQLSTQENVTIVPVNTCSAREDEEE